MKFLFALTAEAHLVDVDCCQWNTFLLELQPDHGSSPGQVADGKQDWALVLVQSIKKYLLIFKVKSKKKTISCFTVFEIENLLIELPTASTCGILNVVRTTVSSILYFRKILKKCGDNAKFII